MEKMENSGYEGNVTPGIEGVEIDLRELIIRCEKLTHEMNESSKKAELNTKRMLLSFIEVVDAFENIFQNIAPKLEHCDQQTKIWIGNFRTIYKILLRALKDAEVTPIETVIGEKANPHWDNVVEVVEMLNRENETIVEVIKKGYLWSGKLLRAADVIAVKNN